LYKGEGFWGENCKKSRALNIRTITLVGFTKKNIELVEKVLFPKGGDTRLSDPAGDKFKEQCDCEHAKGRGYMWTESWKGTY